MRFASAPIASTSLVSTSTATTEGSRMMMPFSLQCTKVLAVPKSIPISSDILLKKLMLGNLNFILFSSITIMLHSRENYNRYHHR